MDWVIKLLGGPIKDVIGGVGGIIDNLHTSDDEKLKAKLELAALESALQIRVMEMEQDFAKTQADVIKSEAASTSWLAANWRPILMLTFTYIIAHTYVLVPVFGIRSVEIPPDMWTLLKIGIGGYVGGRTIEKVTPQIADAMKKR